MSLLNKSDYGLVPPAILHEYAGKDADATRRIYPVLLKKFKKEPELYDYYQTYSKVLLKNLIHSSIIGLHIDRPKLEQATEEFSDYTKLLKKEIQKAAGEKFNLESPKQLGKVLFTKMGFPSLKTTPSGAASCDKQVLAELYEKTGDVFIRNLIEYRQLLDCQTRQVDGVERFLDSHDTVHPAFKVYGTVTGRISAERPPSTTVPRDRDYTFQGEPIPIHIRDFYTAPEGYEFGFGDYKQIELVIIAIVSEDEEMLKLIKSREDIHTGTAKTVFRLMGEPFEEASEERQDQMRRTAKTTNFAIIYGGSAAGTAQKTGTSESAITQFMQSHQRIFKGIWRYKETVPQIAAEHGYLESPFGRRRHVLLHGSRGQDKDEYESRAERQIVNYVPQNGAAEVTNRAYNRICAKFREKEIEGWPVNTVYDSLEFIWKKGHAKRARAIVLREMLRPVAELDNAIFAISFGVGQSWGEAEKSAEDYYEHG